MSDCLILDQNWIPQSFCNYKVAVKLWYEGRATIIKEDESGKTLSSPSLTIGMPRIIVVKNAWKKKKRVSVPCTRRNILTRDRATCQFCGVTLSTSDYTIDHVKPRCQGGITEWTNVVIACVRCNKRKAGQTPEQANMKLLSVPVAPKANDPRYNFKLRVKKLRPEWSDWQEYLYAEQASWYYYNVELDH